LILRTPLVLGVLALAALPVPALADVKADYMAACMEASGDNTELCTCKTEQASKLVDEEMMSYIIIALKEPATFTTMIGEGKVPEAVVKKWPFYVRDSNKACLVPTN
jgi:soluble P-type ATPase